MNNNTSISIVTNNDNYNKSSNEFYISEQDLQSILEEYFSVNCANKIIQNIKQSLHPKSIHIQNSDINSQKNTCIACDNKYTHNQEQQYNSNSNSNIIKLDVSINIDNSNDLASLALSSNILNLSYSKNKIDNLHTLYSSTDSYKLSNNLLIQEILNLLTKLSTVATDTQNNITNINNNRYFNKLDYYNYESIVATKSYLSVIKAIELYCKNNNVKQRTFEVYRNSFKQVISHYLLHTSFLNSSNQQSNSCFSSRSWQDLPIQEISLSMFTKYQASSQNTRFQYFKNIYTILKWLNTYGYIKSNVLEQYIKTINPQPQIMRPALFCENWLNLNEATAEISKFLTYLKLNKPAYYSWIFLLISGTRLQETWRYLKCVYKYVNDNSSNNPGSNNNQSVLNELNKSCYIFIETKTTRNGQNADFRIPINSLIKHLVSILVNLGITTFGKFRYAIAHHVKSSPYYKNIICAHGSRAIFRTVIDYLTTNTNISTEAKEMYLGHKSGSVVSRKYRRHDYFNERLELQNIYAKFILDAANDTELIQYLNKG